MPPFTASILGARGVCSKQSAGPFCFHRYPTHRAGTRGAESTQHLTEHPHVVGGDARHALHRYSTLRKGTGAATPALRERGDLRCDREAPDEAAKKRVDAVLLDLAMKGILGKARRITRFFPGDRVLALSVSGEEREIRGLLRAGVAGYLPRDASATEFLEALAKTVRGESVFPERIGRFLVHEASRQYEKAAARQSIEQLTRRELEVGRLLRLGLSNQEICDRLSIGMGTTKNHVHNLLAKTKTHSRDDFATWLDRNLHPAVADRPDRKI